MSSVEDIDDLLDSALEDFDTVPKGKKKTKDNVNKKGITSSEEVNSIQTEEEFLKIFEDAAKTSNSHANNIEGLMSELGKLTDNSDQSSKLLADTLNQMNKNSLGLSAEPTEEELAAMFANLHSQGGSDTNCDNLIPMMEGMMQSLLSKDLLYPALKDIADKFPDWLADNRTKITEDQYEKHNKQYDLTKRICFIFEEENDKDSESVKKVRFEKVMNLMQEMQSLGQPPKEITGDGGTQPFQFDAQGNPIIPVIPGDQQCTIS